MLVSNVLQECSKVGILDGADYAQGFTTGSNPWGYTLTSIGVRPFKIYTHTVPCDGQPDGSRRGALTVPYGPSRVLSSGAARFDRARGNHARSQTAPTTSCSTEAECARVQRLSSDAEDAEGLPDWEILDVLELPGRGVHRRVSGGS